MPDCPRAQPAPAQVQILKTVCHIHCLLSCAVMPEITSTNSPQYANVNGSANLTCQSRGDPPPRTRWRRPGSTKNIESSRKAIVRHDSIEIVSIDMSTDWGNWTCLSCNHIGCDSTTVQFFIDGRWCDVFLKFLQIFLMRQTKIRNFATKARLQYCVEPDCRSFRTKWLQSNGLRRRHVFETENCGIFPS